MCKIFHPELFQGDAKKTRYFEGWYYKQVSADFSRVLSVIPGVSLAGDPHAFIQVIDGVSAMTHYLEFPLQDFKASRSKLEISIGDNHFSRDHLELNLNRNELQLSGRVDFSGITPWPGNPLAPGIMGWYSFVPSMECYHGVVSMDHRLSGKFLYNREDFDFNGGRGYIEKDWGTSMPESWIWLHANTFEQPGTSVMLSIAKIPWRGKHFTGFICFVLHNGSLYRFMTYNRSRILKAGLTGQEFWVELKNKKHQLRIEATQKSAGKLKAPVNGLMERYIKESVDSSVTVTLSDNSGSRLFSGTTTRAGLELVGNPESLLPPEKF